MPPSLFLSLSHARTHTHTHTPYTQVCGFGVVDCADASLTLHIATRALLQQVTAAFMPAIPPVALNVYAHVFPIWASVFASDEFKGRLLGLHLLGPFINSAPAARGPYARRHVRDPDSAFLDILPRLAGCNVKVITMAAEAYGAEAVCRHATSHNIVVLLGHQLAGGKEMSNLAGAGARGLSQLGGEGGGDLLSCLTQVRGALCVYICVE